MKAPDVRDLCLEQLALDVLALEDVAAELAADLQIYREMFSLLLGQYAQQEAHLEQARRTIRTLREAAPQTRRSKAA